MSIRLFDTSKTVTNQRMQIGRNRKNNIIFSEFDILEMIRCYFKGWEYIEIDNSTSRVHPYSKRILERSFIDDFLKLHYSESLEILEKIISYFIDITPDSNKFSCNGRRGDDSLININTYQFYDDNREIITILDYTAIQYLNGENDNYGSGRLVSAKIRIRDNKEHMEYKNKFKQKIIELCDQFKSA